MISLSHIRKFRNNIFTINAWKVLGTKLFLRLLWTTACRLPWIIKGGDLRDLDRVIGRHATTFHTRLGTVHFDCLYNDAAFSDNTFSFGLIREIYIRDCYLRFFPTNFLSSIKNVIDLGANRGVTSSLLATVCERLVSVEANPSLRELLKHNIRENSRSDSNLVITGFVGGDVGSLKDAPAETVSINQVLSHFGEEQIDLMKIDIEGSEYELFKSTNWLHRIRAVAIEVHRTHGDNDVVINALRANDFDVILASEDLKIVSNGAEADFIYGLKGQSLMRRIY